MNGTTKKTPYKKSAKAHGEDALPFVASLTICVDNGQTFTFSPSEETCLPDDLDLIVSVAPHAAGRLSFWDGQMERALYAVRMKETELKALESKVNSQVRLKLEAESDGGSFVSESSVQAGVDGRKEVIAMRNVLHGLRLDYGLLRSIRDGVSHRVFILNRLIDLVAKSHTALSGHFDT